MLKLVTLCLVVVWSQAQAKPLEINLLVKNKYGSQNISSTVCNKDTQIDFLFSANSKFICPVGTCTVTGINESTMKYMDINGNDLELTLVDVFIPT